MAKNLNSVSFTVLLLVLVMASTGILKSEALDCILGGCVPGKVFHGECGEVPFIRTDLECCNCCKTKYGMNPTICWAAIEGSEKHCHCYKKTA